MLIKRPLSISCLTKASGKLGSAPAKPGVIGPDQISIGFGLLDVTLEASLILSHDLDEAMSLARRFDGAINTPKASQNLCA
ncbi:MAG: hypothetical protein ABJI43_15445 [Roseobacter sp.]